MQYVSLGAVNVKLQRPAKATPKMADEIIDVHAHVVFDSLHGVAREYGPEAGRDENDAPFFRIGGYMMKPMSYEGTVFTDLSLRLSELDRLHIDLQVLSPNPLTFLHGVEATLAADFCRKHNALMAQVISEVPDRLLGLAALPMQDISAACGELERAVNELGLRGAMIGTDFRQGFSCDSLDRLYQKFIDLNVPLFIHASSTDGVNNLSDPRLSQHNLSLSLGYAQEEALAVAQILLGGVLDRHPDIDICVSHGGGSITFLAEKLDQLALFDTTACQGVKDHGFAHELQKLWFDTHVKGEVAARTLRHYAHPGRLVMGTNLGGFDTPDTLAPDAAQLSINAKKLLRLL